MLYALIIMLLMALSLGFILGYASVRLKVAENPIVEQIDHVLPQIQCGQCGFLGCRPYAEAMANGEAEINRCVPGGDDVIVQLAEVLGKEVMPMVMDCMPENIIKGPAFITENECIGCTRCIQVCPVDAIVGAARQMHTVIKTQCTECGLCVASCPVDCIALTPVSEDIDHWKWKLPTSEKRDHQA
jgi:electron transport complex protein RnfB